MVSEKRLHPTPDPHMLCLLSRLVLAVQLERIDRKAWDRKLTLEPNQRHTKEEQEPLYVRSSHLEALVQH